MAVSTVAALPAQAGETQRASAEPKAGKSVATVTLITGDKVTLLKAKNGRTTVLPRAARGREGITFGVREHGKVIAVYPSDAVGLVAQGKLDKRLFDVAGLVAAGYDDAKSKTLPLIVRQRPSKQLGKPKGIIPNRSLPSIGATAVKQTKKDGTKFWGWLVGSVNRKPGTSASLNGTVDKVWLDGKVKATLERSVPQVRAPQAWKAGFTGKGVRVAVLDTGIDENHQDLKGAVVARQDFSGTGDTADLFGHGTHVASIITGNGAKSAGKLKGVAPDVALVNGKVLDNEGFGSESGIIAGMDWATRTAKAKVVNMSLGGDPTDGTDPMSQAVNTLTASTGALFVIAAGNAYDNFSVGTPGAADKALTVAATERDLTTADFSSKGPRVGDFALKPDISAPGVDIAAARAAGTNIGDNLDAFYTRLSGTSMATPHVAGAAAILAQRSPKWKSDQLKTALMSTANAPKGRPWEQGAGFLNVERAVKANVWSYEGSISRFYKWPHTKVDSTSVHYVNRSTKAIKLNVAFHPADVAGAPIPAGVFSGVPKTVTVPAGGTVAVPVKIDPTKSKPNKFYVGTIIASAAGITIRNAVSVHVEPESYDVTLDYTDRNGQKVTSLDRFAQLPVVLNPYTGNFWDVRAKGGKLVARVPKGTTFAVTENLITPGKDEVAPSITVISKPSFAVTANTTVSLDARQAKKVSVKLDQNAQTEFWQLSVMEAIPDTQWHSYSLGFPSPPDAYVLATAPVAGRKYQFTYYQEAEAGDTTYETVSATSQRLPADPTYTVKDSSLSEVTFSIGSGGKALPGALGHGLAYDANGLLFNFGYERPVDLPSTRKHLVTTEVNGSVEALWSGYLYGFDSTSGNALFVQEARERAYSGTAEFRKREFLTPAYGSSAFGLHFGDGGMVLFTEPVNSANGPVFAFEDSIGGQLQLKRNGTVIGSSNNPYSVEALGSATGTATYALELQTGHQLSWLNYGRQVSGSWTFKATKPGAGDAQQYNLVAPRVSGDFSPSGDAPAGSSLPLTIQSDPGTPWLSKVELSISYDDGATWRALTVMPDPDGFKTTAPLPNVASGFASLRIKATGGDPTSTADLTILRAFGIKRVS
ncbi:S8 family peptidase [Tenggerimyces flavus]|uniref:S8 family peptidase n=1 Tax=Tenggerimyces flavus TaxID=1708749 RepID=A0ABV7Y9K9_9ACTN|nr:S8 family peptidase [Tenggerimyces flavus]MBM7785263.1 subtilisin family serine protease [Tenggerimyces flavus]